MDCPILTFCRWQVELRAKKRCWVVDHMIFTYGSRYIFISHLLSFVDRVFFLMPGSFQISKTSALFWCVFVVEKDVQLFFPAKNDSSSKIKQFYGPLEYPRMPPWICL